MENEVYICKTSIENPVWQDFKFNAYNFLEKLGFIPPKDKQINIKPNIVIAAEPDSGIITHPGFVHGVVKYLKDQGVSSSKINILEGGGTEKDLDMPDHWRISGYEKLCNMENISYKNLNFQNPVYIDVDAGVIFDKLGLAEDIADKDNFLINIPKLKCHNFAKTTLAVKNMMGTIVPIEKRHLCRPLPDEKGFIPEKLEDIDKFGNKLIDLYLAKCPDLNIIEGIVGRDGTGFNRGNNHNTNFIVAGVNSIAVDAVTSYLIGIELEGIPYLKAARERNLFPEGIKQFKTYILRGTDFVEFKDLQDIVYKKKFELITADIKKILRESSSR